MDGGTRGVRAPGAPPIVGCSVPGTVPSDDSVAPGERPRSESPEPGNPDVVGSIVGAWARADRGVQYQAANRERTIGPHQRLMVSIPCDPPWSRTAGSS